jgi:hypothetical protein
MLYDSKDDYFPKNIGDVGYFFNLSSSFLYLGHILDISNSFKASNGNIYRYFVPADKMLFNSSVSSLTEDEINFLLSSGRETKKLILSGKCRVEDGETGFFYDSTTGKSIFSGNILLEGVNFSNVKNYEHPFRRKNDESTWRYFIPAKLLFNYRKKQEKKIKDILECNSDTEKESKSNEENNMNNTNDLISSMIAMKMVESMSKDNSSMDIGKLILIQNLTKGEPIKITDVIKTKLISSLNLEGDNLPLDKVMLLQMLESGQLDVNQLIAFKMLGSLFDDKKDTK